MGVGVCDCVCMCVREFMPACLRVRVCIRTCTSERH